MAVEGVDAINFSSFGCSANALRYVVKTIQGFPYDLGMYGAPVTELAKLQHQNELDKLAAECKKWVQGGNFNPGSAVFCLLTKQQLDAKRVLEENGFEELGRTISSHIFGQVNMEEFAKELDAKEVIYLLGKGWYHKPKE